MGVSRFISSIRYYLLGYWHPRDVLLTLSHFQALVATLTGHRPWPVLFYQALGLACALVPPAFFAVRVWRFGRPAESMRSDRRWIAIAAFVALGSLLGYSTGPRSLSYNGLGNGFTLIEAALVLMLLDEAGAVPPRHRRHGFAMALGVVIGTQVVVKATTAAVMGVWIVSAVALLGRGDHRRSLERGAGIALGLVAFAAAFFAAVVPFSAWWGGISAFQSSSSQHSLMTLAASSLGPVVGQLRVAGPFTVISIALVLAAGRLAARGHRVLAAACASAGASIVLAFALIVGLTPGGINRVIHGSTPFAMLVALALSLWFIARSRRRGETAATVQSPSRARLFVLLLVLPPIAAIGTNNPLTVAMTLGLAPWFAILWLVAEEARPVTGRAWTDLVVAAAALIAVAQVWEQQLITPYRLAGGMASQQFSSAPHLEAGRGLRVDADTRQLVESTRALLDRNGFHPGDPVLMFYDE